jgi:hypothetical protein
MIGHMGRFAKILMLAAAACIVLATVFIGPSAAEGSWSETLGPVYSARALRTVEIEGVRLGQTPEQVAAAMAARGFEHVHADAIGGGYFVAPGNTALQPSYTTVRGRQRVDGIMYHILDNHDPAFIAKRDAILATIGQPTRLWLWTTAEGRRGGSFRVVTDRALIDTVAQSGQCFVLDWRCAALRHTDCRPIVRQVSSPYIDGGYSDSHFSIEINDYSARSRALLRDRAFRTQDTTGAACPVLSIH